ncbi:MAG: hypothetical protein CMM00_10905 [Rhodopirellula sp.]|nr:hypothetical protein [Rhodopirellula sp.]
MLLAREIFSIVATATIVRVVRGAKSNRHQILLVRVAHRTVRHVFETSSTLLFLKPLPSDHTR